MKAENIDGGGGYGIFFEKSLDTMEEVWFTNGEELCSLQTMVSIVPSDRW